MSYISNALFFLIVFWHDLNLESKVKVNLCGMSNVSLLLFELPGCHVGGVTELKINCINSL